MSTKKFLLTSACVVIICIHPVEAQSNLFSANEHFERARSLNAVGDPRAEQECRLAIADRGGVYPEAWKWLSSYLAQRLRFDEAARAWRKYLKQTRQRAPQTALERLHRLDRAAELKSRSENGDALSADELAELVKLVDGFGVRGDAIPFAEKALKLYPESTKALVTLADLIKWDQRDRALELLNRAVAFEPNEPTVYVARGWCYFWAHGNPTEAESDFRKAIELSKGSHASAWAGLGDALAREGRRDEAIVAYLKYLSIRPKSAAYYDGEIRKSIKMLRSNSSQP